MTNQINSKYLSILKEEIYKQNNTVREFDFCKDIDLLNSDKFFIDKISKELCFIGKIEKKMKPNKDDILYGNLLENSDGSIEMITDLLKYLGHKACTIFCNETYDINTMPILFFDCELNNKSDHLYLRLWDGEQYSEAIQYCKDKTFTNKEVSMSNLQFNQIFIDTDKIKFDEHERHTGWNKEGIKISNRHTRIQMIINLSTGKIRFLNDGKRFFFEPLLKMNKYNIMLTNNFDSRPKIRELLCAQEEGYIYFKPLKITSRKQKLKLFYHGAPKVEVFSERHKEWIRIKENSIIDSSQEIMIRIKMSAMDILYGMYLIGQ
ncbi:MAG: hypothetical protein GX947_02835 [Tissierellia bacterium]|nr:hypothetical protein [Tissierellia bacterium]